MSLKKFFAVFVVLLAAVTAALPAIPAGAYSYSCQAVYGKPYIFEIGWNITDKTAKDCGSKKVALSDKRSMTVWYSDGLEKDMSDKKVTAALADALNRLKADCSSLSKPVVLSIENVGDDTERLVKRYYKNDDILRYAAVLPFADSKTRSAYLKKSYEADDAAFFSVTLDVIDSAGVTEKYLSKAYADESIALFSICFNSLEDALSDRKFDTLTDTYAAKAYADGRIDFFAVLAGEMDDDVLEKWYGMASKDGKSGFKSICDDDFDDWFDDWFDDDDWDDDRDWTAVPQKYADLGITYSNKHYYYNGEPVRYFLDVSRKTSESIYATVESNPNGKVSIKIVRDKDGNITGVEKLTAKEIKKYFGDAED